MTSAEVLLASSCCTLPTQLERIAETFDIKVISYRNCVSLYEMDIGDIYSRVSHLGFSFHDGEMYICAVNENACGKMRRRWTTAHELAHILLGHVGTSVLPHSGQCETQADSFAAELLAPLGVLHFCGVSSAEEIARLTGISKQASAIRWRELSALRRQHSELMRRAAIEGRQLSEAEVFLPDEASRRMFSAFLPFIAEYITKRVSQTVQ